MTIDQLKTAIQTVEYVKGGTWPNVLYIFELLNVGKAEVISKRWFDPFKEKYEELDLTVLSTWSTYARCIDLKFSLVDNKLNCNATIWNGDNLYGTRTKKRFEVLLILPDEFLITIEAFIEYTFENELESMYESYLSEQKRVWIDKKRDEYLSI